MFQITNLLPKGDESLKGVPLKKKDGGVDYTKDFFKRPAYLTVSGQLSVEVKYNDLHILII